jgi:hypothetical protein
MHHALQATTAGVASAAKMLGIVHCIATADMSIVLVSIMET